MIKDHRPFYLKKAYRRLEAFYVDHFIRPQLKSLGPGHTFMCPWHVELFGWPIEIGKCINVIATRDMKVRLSIWSEETGQGRISIGDYCLVCPGVRIGCAREVVIGDNTMLAHGVYITDSDWHDFYDRVRPSSISAPVRIENNVWIGDSTIICKGVKVGANSIVGAGSVVTADIPPNTIAAGNPARVIKYLDPDKTIVTRADWFREHENLEQEIETLDRIMLKGNTLFSWIRHRFFPRPGE